MNTSNPTRIDEFKSQLLCLSHIESNSKYNSLHYVHHDHVEILPDSSSAVLIAKNFIVHAAFTPYYETEVFAHASMYVFKDSSIHEHIHRLPVDREQLNIMIRNSDICFSANEYFMDQEMINIFNVWSNINESSD